MLAVLNNVSEELTVSIFRVEVFYTENKSTSSIARRKTLKFNILFAFVYLPFNNTCSSAVSCSSVLVCWSRNSKLYETQPPKFF